MLSIPGQGSVLNGLDCRLGEQRVGDQQEESQTADENITCTDEQFAVRDCE